GVPLVLVLVDAVGRRRPRRFVDDRHARPGPVALAGGLVALCLGSGLVRDVLDLAAVGGRALDLLLALLGRELHLGATGLGVVLLALIRDVARILARVVHVLVSLRLVL